MNAVAALLKSEQGMAVPLKGVAARGRLTGLVFELAVEQTYENTGGKNIEAEYTFPVPHRAVLLGLEIRIGERELKAVAARRQVARERYEQAIDEGNTAVMLEQSGDGLYSVSLGNLMAGERALIRYRYAEILDRSGDDVRLTVPTVIAPRYGAPAEHGLAPHQAPGVDVLAAYPLTLEIDIEGDMARTGLASPTHAITAGETAGGRRVRLAAGASLDRDFVLTVTGIQTRSTNIVARDGEGYVALVSLDPRLDEQHAAPMALKLVVDCSGSMGGTSIECARRALLAILDRLDGRDRVSITRFGSTVEHVPARAEESPVGRGLRGLFGPRTLRTMERGGVLSSATPAVIEWLRHQVRHLNADLGGTELAAGLAAAMEIHSPDAAVKDLLLITDCEVWALESVLDQAVRSGHRLFVVAVGAAPAEPLARQLAERTGGACEFVTPGEDAEAAIVRMFRRMRETPKHVARVEWPATPLWEAPLPPAVFAGDTLHLIAGFARAPVGTACVVVAGDAGGDRRLESVLAGPVEHEVLPRLVAAKRLATLPEEQATALAERYQLASRWTNYIVVHLRDAEGRATALPELRAVPQMLAAGWGATAACDARLLSVACADFGRPPLSKAMDLPAFRRQVTEPSGDFMPDAAHSLAEERADDIDACCIPEPAGLAPAEILQALWAFFDFSGTLPRRIDELAGLGVPISMLAELQAIAARLRTAGDPAIEERVVRVWIALLASTEAGAGLDPVVRDRLKGQVLADRDNRRIRSALAGAVRNVTADSWRGRSVAESLMD